MASIIDMIGQVKQAAGTHMNSNKQNQLIISYFNNKTCRMLPCHPVKSHPT